MSLVLKRVWRRGWADWAVEVWRPRVDGDPPEPKARIIFPDEPNPPAGMVRAGTDTASSRRRAKRKAERMGHRVEAGLDPHSDKPIPEDWTDTVWIGR